MNHETRVRLYWLLTGLIGCEPSGPLYRRLYTDDHDHDHTIDDDDNS